MGPVSVWLLSEYRAYSAKMRRTEQKRGMLLFLSQGGLWHEGRHGQKQRNKKKKFKNLNRWYFESAAFETYWKLWRSWRWCLYLVRAFPVLVDWVGCNPYLNVNVAHRANFKFRKFHEITAYMYNSRLRKALDDLYYAGIHKKLWMSR